MTAKEFLARARRLQMRIDQLVDAKMDVFAQSTYGTETRETASVNPGAMSRRTEAYTEYVDQIECERVRLIEVKTEILAVVNQVPDNTLAALLTSYYINGKTWEQTAVDLRYSYRHLVHILHPRALSEVERILKKMS